MRAFGLVCGVDPSGSPVRVQKIGRFFVAGDSVMVFADNDPDIASDDTILSGVVDSNVDTTQTCSGADTAQSLTVGALATALANDTVRIGATGRPCGSRTSDSDRGVTSICETALGLVVTFPKESL